MSKKDDYYNTIELLFDKFVYPEHPSLECWEIDEESETLLLHIDMNKVDFSISKVIEYETFYLTEEEHDQFISEYFYDIVTNEILKTVAKSLQLIQSHYKIDFILFS